MLKDIEAENKVKGASFKLKGLVLDIAVYNLVNATPRCLFKLGLVDVHTHYPLGQALSL